jgi:hypothetical protein
VGFSPELTWELTHFAVALATDTVPEGAIVAITPNETVRIHEMIGTRMVDRHFARLRLKCHGCSGSS